MFKKFSGLVALSLVLMFALSACGSLAAPACCEAVRSISANGSGKVTLVPDVAYINIGVHSESETVKAALKDNNTKATAIGDALKALGIEDKDIQTTSFNVYPSQKYDAYSMDYSATSTEPVYVYMVDNTVSVTVRDLAKLGDALDAAVQAGANNIYGISFDVLDKTEALAQARKLAIQDAKDNAAKIAAEAGITLGDVINVSVYASGGYGYDYGMKSEAMDAGGVNVPISAGSLLITMEASITYEIK